MSAYQPKTGEKCHCKRGIERDNCPDCEGTGWRIDFRAIRGNVKHRRVLSGDGTFYHLPAEPKGGAQ